MKKFYDHQEIEIKIQNYWEKKQVFKVIEDYNKKKYYCLSMLPYPSGKLHMGHVRNYTIGDVIARYQRMLGKNVLHPIGWDSFGLPAEKAAINNNCTPANWIHNNIIYMKKQLKSLGFSYDWSREINTCEPKYYYWEQWFFIILYNKGLVYKKKTIVNWCPKDKTVLANEQVVNNCCWRCDNKIEYKKIPQWFIKITSYADELLYGLNKLQEWPEQVKIMQSNWIGRSEGINIKFNIVNSKEKLIVYTMNPSIIMGVTYILLSINHPLLIKIAKKNVILKKFIQKNNFNEINNLDKSFINNKYINIGINAIHPLTNELLPILATNIIIYNYNCHAIMAAPGHNKQEWEIANKFSLPIKFVILNSENKRNNLNEFKIINEGILFNSHEFNGLHSKYHSDFIIKALEKKNIGIREVRYLLRDWGVSRQRYWGVPIPMLTLENGDILPVPYNKLPVILPQNTIIDGISNPLKNDINWLKTTYKNKLALRETDTFDTFMESSWYYARYTCPNYNLGMLDTKISNYWLPVDQYIGGIEHAIMHLMYFRFYHKLLRDINLVNSDEPVKRLLCQGMVLSDAFFYLNDNDERIWVSPNDVNVERDKNGKIIKATDLSGRILIHAGMCKMSKSKNNGIDPQIIINKYGADTVRLFIMFAAPTEMPLEWKEDGIKGANRFLNRLWNLIYKFNKEHQIYLLKNKEIDFNKLNDIQKKIINKTNNTIIKVTNDMNYYQTFNTSIASIMELTNTLNNFQVLNNQDEIVFYNSLIKIIKMLYPFAPHICFSFWKILNIIENIDTTSWPVPIYIKKEEKTKLIIIQVNGKLRGKIQVSQSADKKLIYEYVIKNNLIHKYIENKNIKNFFYVPDKLINFVVI